MANLRNYFEKYESITQTDIDSGTVRTDLQAAGTVITLMPFCQSTPGCCDTKDSTFMTWCVPTDVETAKMTLWGAGGGGAGARDCQQGVPGGSGAFAQKTLTVTPGDCYELCVGNGSRCQEQCCDRGCRGCCSFITGPGLTNFIAEGGYGGKACDCAYWHTCCIGETCGYWYMDLTDKAQFSGADTGAEGVLGFAFSYCGCNTNNCYWKQALPYPGGIVNKQGGNVFMRVQGNTGTFNTLYCFAQTILGGSSGNHAPGLGAPSASSCGGGSCYGWHGGPGMIKIDYR